MDKNEETSGNTGLKIPVWIVITASVCVVFVIGVLLCIVFYMAGRQSAMNTATPGVSAVNQAMSGSNSVPDFFSGKNSSPAAVEAPPPYQELPVNGSAAVPAEKNAGASDRQSVENYFLQLEAIGAGAKQWQDPNEFAQQMVQSIMSNDFSKFDDFMANYELSISKIDALKAPEACREHKKLMLQVLYGGRSMLSDIRNSVSTGNVEALSGLPARAEDIKQKSQTADNMAKAIKERYGIK